MFKLPSFPSARAGIDELADFAELLCWACGSTSKSDIIAYLKQISDNDYNSGCDDDEDESSDLLDDTLIEIDRRASACGDGYPFRLDKTGTVLYPITANAERGILYRYLLLSTRLNMKSSRLHAAIDGANLLEELGAHTLKNYLGRARSKSVVFGTAEKGGFPNKIEKLCRALGEGGQFHNIDGNVTIDAKDDKLDVVAWIPFSDGCKGQLIIFAQCKTGTSYDNQITQTDPAAFIKRWMRDGVLVNPVRALCLSDSINRNKWNSRTSYAGLIFDRCRMVDFCDNISAGLLDEISRWTDAAMATVNLSKS